MIFLGFDPGGKDNFGWAKLCISNKDECLELSTGIASNAFTAFKDATANLVEEPKAAGIDAPLFWVYEDGRIADETVRKLFKEAGGKNSSGTVQHFNSLRGACLVQGVLIGRLISDEWPSIVVTEAHPKALLKIDKAAMEFIDKYDSELLTLHQRDAALAAFSAWAAYSRKEGWRDLFAEEINPFLPVKHPVSYWFPKNTTINFKS